MPTLQGRGPFSYESLSYNSGNTYALNAGSATAPKTQFDSTNGETLEVFANAVLLEGDGSVANATDAAAESPAHGFFVNSLTNPTSITLVSNISAAQVVLVRRISNRATPEVDFAPGSVIREQDLDSSTNQAIHVAQEAIDIALQGIVLDVDDKWDAQTASTDRVIKGVANGGTDVNDAVNYGQLITHDTTITGYMQNAEDYKNTAISYATRDSGVAQTYTNDSASDTSDHSAKAHASVVGTHAPSTGSAKEWAQTTGVPIDSTYSSKEYAQGSVLAAGGSAKNWATLATTPSATAADASAKEWATGTSTHKNDGSAKSWAQDTNAVDGAGANDRSAKAWSQGASMTGATLGGSSKDWANTLVTAIDGGTGFSAKEYAQGVTASTGGSAKDWATYTANDVRGAGSGDMSAKEWATGVLGRGNAGEGSSKDWATRAEDSTVDNAGYSALHWAAKAEDARIAAANSAAAVSQVYDNFNDVYLGSMRTDKTVADAVTLTGASWAKDSSSIAFSGISSGTVTIGQELTTVATGYPLEANIIGTQLTTPIVISNPFTVAGTGATLAFAGTGVYGAFNDSKGGPALNNDGDALVNGNLYFNPQANEMRIYDGANWIAATAVGQVSLLEYKFVTTSGQVSSRTYSGAANVGGTLSYTQSNILVFMNGVQLKESVVDGATHDYAATNGTSIVLAVAPVLNDEISVIAYKSFTTADMVSKSAGGTFSGAVTFGAGLVANTADINGGTIDGATITGNIVGNASGTAATVTGATQSAITTATNLTSVGTLTALTGGTGDFNWDSNTLVVDSSASAVGIGTAAPTTALHIHGNSSTDGGSITFSNLADDNTAYNEITFETVGDDDTTLREAASIQVLYDDHAGTNPSGTFKFSTRDDAGTFAERMRVDSSGEVLIGTTTQGRETDLAIVGANQDATGVWSQVGIYSNDSQAANKGGSLMFGGQDGTLARQWFAGIEGKKENSTSGNYAGYLAFSTRPAGSTPVERMRIDSSGNVGIGTDAPTSKLHVNGPTGTGIVIQNSGTTENVLAMYGTSTGELLGYIQVSATTCSLVNHSDERLKNIEGDLKTKIDTLSLLKNVHPKYGTFKKVPDEKRGFFIAQQVKEFIPESVFGSPDDVDEEGNPVFMGMDATLIVPYIWSICQKQQELIETLETKVTALENA